jgi:LPS-assembly protein
VSIDADSIRLDRVSGAYVADGNVVITQGGVRLEADSVTLNTLTGDASAAGHVRLADQDNVLMSESIDINFDTRLGVIKSGELFVARENYHITGESVERVSEDEYRVKSGSLTTCDADRPFWRVTAGDLNVRMDKDVRARNVVMRIKDVPVLYSPYAWFPLLKPRTSGFLLPRVGYSTEDGFRLFNSFYWAPVDNFDATASIDYRSKRGPGFSLETRWAPTPNASTRLYGYFMNDRKNNAERYNLMFTHDQDISDNTAAKVDVNLSDRRFYRDLADSTLDRTQRSIDSNAFLTRSGSSYMSYLFGQYTQGLFLNDDYIVQRLPELGLSLKKRRLWDSPFYFDSDASAAYFEKSKGVTGGRFDIFPKLSANFDLGGIYVTPSVGYRETVYELAGKEKSLYDEERGMFGAGLSVQTALSRLFSFGPGPGISSVRHTMQPLVAYNFVSLRGGDEFAKFDEIDTYGRKSAVAYSLTNRFVLTFMDDMEERSVHFLTVKLGQFYDHYNDTKVSGVYRRFSAMYGELVYDADRMLTIKSDLRYNLYSGKLLSENTDIKLTVPSRVFSLVLGHRYSTDTDQTFMSPTVFGFFTPSTEFDSKFGVFQADEDDKINFLSAEVGVMLWDAWGMSAKVWYDTRRDDFRETRFSVNYSSQCWGVTASYSKSPGDRQFMLLLNLKGLGVVKM